MPTTRFMPGPNVQSAHDRPGNEAEKGRVPRRAAPDAAAFVPGGVARPPHLLRPEPSPRRRALPPFRAPHDRPSLRRPGQGADRAGAGVPPGRLLRRCASRSPPRHPGGRGQKLLLALRRGVPGAPAGRLQDGGALRGRVVEGWRQVPAAFPPGWFDAHAAARPRLFSPGPVEPRERLRPLPR